MKKKIKVKAIVLFLLMGYICYVFINQQVTMYKIKNQINTLTAEKQKVMEKNQKLQDEIKLSKTDEYIEKLARERLGLIKQGETPVINNKK